ncbi:hypothetical protein ACF8C4_06055, partial [Myroides odoratimimus]
ELIQVMYAAYEKNKEQGELKYNILFEEFYKNVINESKTINMEQINFYLNNTEVINKIVLIKEQYEQHISKQIIDIEQIYNEEFDFELLTQRHILYLKNKSNPDLRFTLLYNNLFKEKPSICIIVELQYNLLTKFRNNYKLDSFSFDDTEQRCLINEFTKNKHNWGHFAIQHFDLSQDNIINLAEFINIELNKSAVLNIYKKITNSPLFDAGKI